MKKFKSARSACAFLAIGGAFTCFDAFALDVVHLSRMAESSPYIGKGGVSAKCLIEEDATSLENPRIVFERVVDEPNNGRTGLRVESAAIADLEPVVRSQELGVFGLGMVPAVALRCRNFSRCVDARSEWTPSTGEKRESASGMFCLVGSREIADNLARELRGVLKFGDR